ncbi:hypothetical protein BWQ96_04128 [Gracilariopsis chorda]|uniref:OTU domain-containing protein n=1 Tax=Gracilariopsis chorda TaxID=448386 RepID=A0A2V3IVG7_9FLOR|nr:hypothetical protein BWQ96_04128 [Gracilariopsis chorda]|eukprot:PXF46122.1 hypothetical protein BWQ96_04128 [Gracilariopsis chorda]
MTATPSGGDCGFHAISWALLHLSGPTLSSTDVRRKLSTHVRQNTAFYSDLLRRQGHWELADETANAVATFSRSVLMEGVNGHWLGQMWGEIELLALAKAFTVCVELYCFEVAPQQLRRYARFEEGKRVVRLLFTGSAQAGHFDVLLPRRTWW